MSAKTDSRCLRASSNGPAAAPLLYLHSLMKISCTLNIGDFAKKQGIARGVDESVVVQKVAP